MGPGLRRLVLGALLAVPLLLGTGLWLASNQLLFPAWKGATRDLAVCG